MRIATIVAAGALALSAIATAVPPAQADGAQHITLPEDYDAAEHFTAGEQLCVPWAGTFHEIRHGAYDILVPPGGQVTGEAHVNGTVSGAVGLLPDDKSLPSYTGTYREKINGIFLGTDDQGNDVLRVARFALTTVLVGSDGSRLTLRLSGKVTVDANGRTVVSRDRATCS